MRAFARAAVALGAVAAFLPTLGCGPTEPPLFDVSGTVSYLGKPVPKGMVYFDPDAAKGTQGQMGFAEVIDGQFDTKKEGKGVRGGPYNIRVSGFDGKPAYEMPYGKPLFNEYRTTKDFPKEPSTFTVEVPKGGSAP
jgi:hypothetical protein